MRAYGSRPDRIPGTRNADAKRRRGPVYYGGMCACDGCDRKQVDGRIYCAKHLDQVRRGEAPHDNDLTPLVMAAPEAGTLADVLMRRNFAGWKPNTNRNGEGT